MPTKVPHNCFQCSKIGTDDAKLKSCWDSKLCPARRHYHRNRGKLSLERKAKRLGSSNIAEIAVNIPTGFAASMIFYRERQDAPVHAIAAEVWQTDKGAGRVPRLAKVLAVQPMHCLGLTPAQVVEVMVEILKACSSELGVSITKFANKVELHPCQCPILDCPINSIKYDRG
jgi:hypothetical protein